MDFQWVMDKLDEKIIYGSDFPEYGLKEYLEYFEALADNRTFEIRKKNIFTNVQKLIMF